MRRSSFILLFAATALVGACGSDESSDPAGEASAAATSSVPPVGDDGEAPTAASSVPATEPPATTPATPATPAPSTPPTDAATGSDGLDGCLVGSWVMKRDSLDVMAATAVPFAGITITDGGMSLVFAGDGSVTADAKFTAAFDMGGTSAEADVFWKHAGTWTTSDGVVTMTYTEQESGITEVRQAGMAMGGMPMEPIDPINGGPYTCTDQQLLITATNGSIEIPMNFER